MLCRYYSSGLSPHLRNLYEEKLKGFNITDPYDIPFFQCEEDVHKWPEIEHGDIVNYLVFSTHSITHNEMKSYKSLEAHNYYTSGWVNNRVFIKVLAEDRALLLGEVKHSQSVRASPLKVWLLCKKDGEILTGHCNCMAGMGEACSHIGAFLFFLEAGIRLKKDESCTDKKNAWIQPYIKDVEYSQLKDIDFHSASAKLKSATEKKQKKQKIMPSSVPEPSDDEIHQLFANLDNAGLSSAVLTVVEPFNSKFISEEDTINKLTNLYSSEHKKLSWQHLLDKCRDISKKLVVTKSDSETIEKSTKGQYKNKKWFTYRTGRVTASTMKAVCRTDIDCPAKSVIKKICYPSLQKFSNCATEWGKTYESVAKGKYTCETKINHLNFKISENGLYINPNYPFIGATPDATINCDCCGQGIIEVKCPYVSRDCTLIEMSQGKNSFLVEDEAGNLSLDKTHDYFYQVQTQLLVTNTNHCDFIVWTNKDFYIERIYPDEVLQETISEKALLFFNFCILPELLAKWHSNNFNYGS